MHGRRRPCYAGCSFLWFNYGLVATFAATLSPTPRDPKRLGLYQSLAFFLIQILSEYHTYVMRAIVIYSEYALLITKSARTRDTNALVYCLCALQHEQPPLRQPTAAVSASEIYKSDLFFSAPKLRAEDCGMKIRNSVQCPPMIWHVCCHVCLFVCVCVCTHLCVCGSVDAQETLCEEQVARRLQSLIAIKPSCPDVVSRMTICFWKGHWEGLYSITHPVFTD